MKLVQVVAVSASALVMGGLVAGFTIIGPPNYARDIAVDRKRVDDLTDISGRLRTRYHDTGEFPTVLSPSWPHDPVTREPYGYRRITPERYVLCATFTTASEDDDNPGSSFWSHGAGQKCYSLDKSSEPLL